MTKITGRKELSLEDLENVVGGANADTEAKYPCPNCHKAYLVKGDNGFYHCPRCTYEELEARD